MDWILSHMWVVVVIAGLIAKVLQAARGKQPTETKDPEVPRRQEFVDAELAERTRKIREEIQRKIAERRGQTIAPAAAEPDRPRLRREDRSPEATPPPAVLELPPIFRRMLAPQAAPVPPPLPAQSNAAAAELARQAALAEQLRQVEAQPTGDERRAAFASAIADKEQAALVAGRAALLDDLHSPDALRRAFILREVLGPPVALRN
jgi:hypothetical protein